MTDAKVPERVPVSKKLRFDVFKRDSFTCQYCGRKAPDIVLHCDHIKPVAEGGTTDILNLIASCFDCNSGKGRRPLTENATLSRQVDQLADLNARREQIEMMLQWRDDLMRLSDDTLEQVVKRIIERGEYTLNESGLDCVRRWLKKYSAGEILAAADQAFDLYLEHLKDEPTIESWEKAFAKIPAFLNIRRQEQEKPYIGRLVYIQGIIRKRARRRFYNCVDYLEHLHLCGLTLDEIERMAKMIPFWGDVADFEKPLDDWLASIGKPF